MDEERIEVSEGGRRVAAVLERTGDSWRLERIEKVEGEPPDAGHLIGGVFPDLDAARRAIKAAFKASGDTLDNVLIDRESYEAWMELARRAAASLRGVNPTDIPDERARALPSGELEIYVEIKGKKKISMKIPAGRWKWRSPPN